MVNNLGGTSNFEMTLLARSLVTQIENDSGCKVTRLLVGSFMTSFNMQGASVSIMPLTGEARDVLSLIDADTDAPAWAKVDVWSSGASRPSDIEIDEVPGTASSDEPSTASLPPILIDNFADVAHVVLRSCCEILIMSEPLLTKYDTIVGDGDCGLTMARGANEISHRLESGKLRLGHPSSLFSDLADAVSASMGGTSGILLELMFRKVSTSLLSSTSEGIASKDMAIAFRAGVEAVSFYGGAQEGSRTMLDALFPASAAMLSGEGSAANIVEAAKAAEKGVDATAAMDHAEAGRSNYLSKEVLMGTPDPGAAAVAIVLATMTPIISQLP